jgi:hypothetical protein
MLVLCRSVPVSCLENRSAAEPLHDGRRAARYQRANKHLQRNHENGLMKLRHYTATVVAGLAVLAVIVFGWAQHSLENVRKQRRLITELEQLPGRIGFHEDRYVAPVWLQNLQFDEPLRCVKSVEFDFEDHPEVTTSHIRSLACFSELESINSQVMGLTGDGLAALQGLKHLTELDVCAWPLSQAGFQNISRLQNLTSLNICDTHATDAEMNLIAELDKLESLAVSGKELTDKGVEKLSTLRELKFLGLYEQPITDESLRHIGRMSRLESLDLLKTNIDGSGLHHLSELRNLKTLKLSGPNIDDNDIERLKKTLGL